MEYLKSVIDFEIFYWFCGQLENAVMSPKKVPWNKSRAQMLNPAQIQIFFHGYFEEHSRPRIVSLGSSWLWEWSEKGTLRYSRHKSFFLRPFWTTLNMNLAWKSTVKIKSYFCTLNFALRKKTFFHIKSCRLTSLFGWNRERGSIKTKLETFFAQEGIQIFSFLEF